MRVIFTPDILGPLIAAPTRILLRLPHNACELLHTLANFSEFLAANCSRGRSLTATKGQVEPVPLFGLSRMGVDPWIQE
jgi:hypothetical protein